MGALASAAVASFLVEAFQLYVGGDLMGIPFLKEIGESAGSLGGVAGATLVALAMGVSPVYAMLVGASVLKFGLLPGSIAGYLISFLVKQIEKRVPEGLDLIVCIVIAAPLTRLIAQGMDPVVTATLKQTGGVITTAADTNPIVMGIILGGVITVVATAPPIAGLMVMYGFNDPMKVTLCFLCIMVSGIISGYIGSLLFKNYPIRTAAQIRGTEERQQNRQLNRIVVSNFS
ncbi:PTS sugar transporter subunit IIC [Bacillus bingmayongensis]